jgi:hypothetical protein
MVCDKGIIPRYANCRASMVSHCETVSSVSDEGCRDHLVTRRRIRDDRDVDSDTRALIQAVGPASSEVIGRPHFMISVFRGPAV